MLPREGKQEHYPKGAGTNMVSAKDSYEVVWPSGRRVVKDVSCAQRLSTLDGKTICELWNWNFQGNKIFPMIEKELAEQYRGIKFINYNEFGSTRSSDGAKNIEALPQKLKQHKCDAVISGVGC